MWQLEQLIFVLLIGWFMPWETCFRRKVDTSTAVCATGLFSILAGRIVCCLPSTYPSPYLPSPALKLMAIRMHQILVERAFPDCPVFFERLKFLERPAFLEYPALFECLRLLLRPAFLEQLVFHVLLAFLQQLSALKRPAFLQCTAALGTSRPL